MHDLYSLCPSCQPNVGNRLVPVLEFKPQFNQLGILGLEQAHRPERWFAPGRFATGLVPDLDFPEAWPELLPTLLQIISGTGPDSQVHGALRVLSELVESGFSEEQFFAVARDLVNGLQIVALNTERKPIVRAMAMSVFRACFDTLEMVMEDHKIAVKGFLDEALKGWMPFFVDTIKLVLPEPPAEADETKEEGLPSQWRGLIALKLQVVKV